MDEFKFCFYGEGIVFVYWGLDFNDWLVMYFVNQVNYFIRDVYVMILSIYNWVIDYCKVVIYVLILVLVSYGGISGWF